MQSENKDDSMEFPSRYHMYLFAKRHIAGECKPEVFPIGENELASVCGERRTEPKTKVASAVTTREGGRKENNFLIAHALDANYHKGQSPNGQCKRTMIHTAFQGETREYSDISPTISTPSGGGHLPMAVERRTDEGLRTFKDNIYGTLRGMDSCGDKMVVNNQSIRRLTPIECERLQGFPDGWTKYGIIDGKKVEISDTQRYKCLGNAVTTNVITAIIERFVS